MSDRKSYRLAAVILVVGGALILIGLLGGPEPEDRDGSSGENGPYRVVDVGGETGDGFVVVAVAGDLLRCTRTFEGDPMPLARDQDELGMAPGVRLECPEAVIQIVSAEVEYAAE